LQQKEEENKEGENSCSEGDFKDNKEESTLLSSLKRSAISRPSVTQSQLHAKHTRDNKETEQEKVRTELFVFINMLKRDAPIIVYVAISIRRTII
jgi:hypothetical protein